ncbi:MAG: UDP-4-amino-4,6-dideoxy-N-acetyl-beta-L-altrosamine transaminase [Alphaproteobacteria bacterium]|nr:UDP-4-amino-4,6-dideoxy-N-acetyl-beta-L-altrosamine transaminase [Alphaproteobacteria bacterium]
MADPELPFLPYGRQSIDADDVAAVARAVEGETISRGAQVSEFERAIERRTGAQTAVACANGTAALHMAALALQLQPGERVIVPAITFVATANAARYVGAEVTFADVDPDSGLMTPETLAQALAAPGTGAVRSVFPVHLNGQVGDVAGIRDLARRHGLSIVEDAAHAFGTTYAVGTAVHRVGACDHADMAIFSAHPVKAFTTGEGGIVTTRSSDFASGLAFARNHGITREADRFQDRDLAFGASNAPNPWYYEMHELGFNYWITDIQCALGLSQLAKLERMLERRRALAARYEAALAALSPLVRVVPRTPGCVAAWHLFVVLIDFAAAGRSRAEVMNALRARGIGSQVHYIPVPWQPYYRRRYGDVSLPGAAAYYARCLSLPLFPAMTDVDVGRVVAALGQALNIPA